MSKPSQLITQAVVRNGASPASRILDRVFAHAFKGLVYAQIWEDPVVDMAGLDIRRDSRIITIASGGCNELSYLVADPQEIIAVDLNTAHIALNRLKLAAIGHLPSYPMLRSFLAEADDPQNPKIYSEWLEPHLDDATRRYWNGRDFIGRKRITGFSRGIYKRGLLGGFIGAAHLIARLYGIDPRTILAAASPEEQRRIFDERLAPLFERRLIRWLSDRPAALFGLGIPPAQFKALAGDRQMADVLKGRLEKLACQFPVNDNYFAWQAFGRGYGREADHPLPPYLQEANFAAIRERIGRIKLRHANFVDELRAQASASLDRYVLLDAQDWMDDTQLNCLWSEIMRTARPGARVLFRTAGEPSLLPGRVSDAILARWQYQEAESQRLSSADRSSIYGGVHLYVLAQ